LFFYGYINRLSWIIFEICNLKGFKNLWENLDLHIDWYWKWYKLLEGLKSFGINWKKISNPKFIYCINGHTDSKKFVILGGKLVNFIIQSYILFRSKNLKVTFISSNSKFYCSADDVSLAISKLLIKILWVVIFLASL